MDIKALKIETILKQKQKVLYGTILENYNKNLGIKDIVNYLKDKNVEIDTLKTKIKLVDGYISNTNPNILNIFILFDDGFDKNLEIGDVVNII